MPYPLPKGARVGAPAKNIRLGGVLSEFALVFLVILLPFVACLRPVEYRFD